MSPQEDSAAVAPLDLTLIDSLTARRQGRLKAAGIQHAEDLAHADLARLAAATGISIDALRDYQHKAAALVLSDLLRVLGPRALPILAEVGFEHAQRNVQAVVQDIARKLNGREAGKAREAPLTT